MRVHELMIGNLVKSKKGIVRVSKLGPDDVVGGYIEEQYDVFTESELEPIKLTAEWLNSKGITLVEVGDNGLGTPPKNVNRYEKWFIHTTFHDTYLWHDRLTDKWHLQDMTGAQFIYIHDLQNALRLCWNGERVNGLEI